MTNTDLYLIFALGPDYTPQTLVGAARTFVEGYAIQDDHLRRREAPMANGCMMFHVVSSEAQAKQLLEARNPYPLRDLEGE
jgi:hypothetical protein